MAGSILASESRCTGTAIFGLIFYMALSAPNTTGLLWVYRCTNAMGNLKALLFSFYILRIIYLLQQVQIFQYISLFASLTDGTRQGGETAVTCSNLSYLENFVFMLRVKRRFLYVFAKYEAIGNSLLG